jgi:hypothetical protein
LLPENVAVNELPTLTVVAEKLTPVTLGGFAGGNSVDAS